MATDRAAPFTYFEAKYLLSQGGSTESAKRSPPSSIVEAGQVDMKGSDSSVQEAARTWPMTEIAKHRTRGDAWVVIDDRVFDVTSWALEHPGGTEIILACAGGDASREFADVGHSSDAREKLDGLQIGVIREATKAELAEEASAADSKDVLGESVYRVGVAGSTGGVRTEITSSGQEPGGVLSTLRQRTPSFFLTYPSLRTTVAVGVALTAVVIAHRTVVSLRSTQ